MIFIPVKRASILLAALLAASAVPGLASGTGQAPSDPVPERRPGAAPSLPGTPERPDSTGTGTFALPDSLAHLSPWSPDFRTMEPIRTRPAVSMTSVVELRQENLPRRIMVIDNNTLRLGEHFNLSNGQAWNWGPYPNAFLDARTLSFPLPR